MRYVDAHCHLQFDTYKEDQKELITRMKEEEVAGIVVGVDKESSIAAAELAGEFDNLYASVGLHPNRVETEEYDEHKFRNLLMYSKVVAIGECGLDYYRPKEVTDAVKAKQKEIFAKHVRLAGTTSRPLIIHARPTKGTQDAYQDVIAILRDVKKEFPDLRGDIHFFVGGIEEAKAFFELGFTISFTAVITFARDYDAVIKFAPLGMILSETDSPYVPPTSRARGSRNDPMSIQEVALKISEIRGEDFDTVRQALTDNAVRLFGL